MSKPKKQQQSITETRLKNAINKTRGNITHMAKSLKTSRSAIHHALNRLELYDYLKEVQDAVIDDVHDVFLDMCLVEKREKSVHLFMQTRGRSLGYGQNITIGKQIEKVDDLIEAFDNFTPEERLLAIKRLAETAS